MRNNVCSLVFNLLYMPKITRKLLPVLLLLGMLMCASCSKTPLTGDALNYVGYWKSANGSTLEIMANGGGSCKKLSFDGTVSSSKSLSGAQVIVKSPVLTFKLLGIDMAYHIDAQPAPANGQTRMKLDGMDFIKMN